MLPEVNSTTLNPWIQPYSYATPRSTVKRIKEIEGVLSQPDAVTTISPFPKSSNTPVYSFENQPSPGKSGGKLWGDVNIQKYTYEYNKETAKEEDLLFPPERFKIVEENLDYLQKVRRQWIILDFKYLFNILFEEL